SSRFVRWLQLCFFFFSSRRRHTRFSRDWSSDVCSSDLLRRIPTPCSAPLPGGTRATSARTPARTKEADHERLHPPWRGPCRACRSEERRVGKECRSRGGREH